ncbi:uncharacterized protein BJX67DRAFT_100980 [Aspergillus lucknowensis]|uniref:Uncharacterized protein n=1 Tax=Aspergillus lucknowensis TaxID=176173 RepID=A0ABR4M6A4_9EURO
MLVVNGWDGLSTNPVAMTNLFAPYINEVQIMMRIFVVNPLVFRQVSVKDAVEVLRGKVEGKLEDLEMPYHTPCTRIDTAVLPQILRRAR